ncbi:hypothetical protein [Streptomyces sp. NPDC059575]|uniref:hypothetical protein n=1 Tax=Streptomyces sp. NPDC059575 TaxID=3346872 RepID=UPI00367E2FFB
MRRIMAGVLYGHKDGERLFFCSSFVLAVAWIVERGARKRGTESRQDSTSK